MTTTVGPVDDLDPFGSGSLTDVAGVQVGHHQRRGRGWRTGTTVVFCPGGVVAAVDVRGGGPGTRETDALAPTNLVDRIHAVCLSGGSAYGLASADGVLTELERRGLGVAVGQAPHEVVPVVPTAVVFDLGRGGEFANRPTPEFGATALRRASGRVRRGSIGAGTGTVTGGLQGGVGMASTEVTIGGRTVVIAALAVVNSAGSPIDPATGLPWATGHRLGRPSAAEKRAVVDIIARRSSAAPPLNTTIGVVATDLALDRPDARRVAMSAHDGLARAVRPAHGLTDGDTVFAVSTGRVVLDRPGPADLRSADSRPAALAPLHDAAARMFERACLDAVMTAVDRGGPPAYRSVCPGVFARRRSGYPTGTTSSG